MKTEMIYLDNASTTKVDPEVVRAMQPYFSKIYGTPTTEYGHSFGLKASEAIEISRETIAKRINAEPEEIIFTSGGTESNNLAIKGLAYIIKERDHIITSKSEHKSVLNVFKSLEGSGFKTTYLNVDREGFVDLEQLRNSITKRTFLVSIQHANQEVGTIQNIKDVGEICQERSVFLHTDAVQSFTKAPIDVDEMEIDLLSISAHLIHGPKGIGALYKRRDVEIKELIEGEYNEFGLRAGTENIPNIVGFAKSVEIAKEKEVKHMTELRDILIKKLLKMPDSKLNGPEGKKRICNNVNVTFRYVEGESLLLHLDMRGIIVTTGSACFSKTLEPSHVILALGLKHEDAHGSVRFSLSKYNTEEEMEYTVENVRDVVEKLREISSVGG